jgi:hypothetical protein
VGRYGLAMAVRERKPASSVEALDVRDETSTESILELAS